MSVRLVVKKVRLIRNQDVRRLLVGTPSSDEDICAIFELKDEFLVFQSATVHNLERGFDWVYQHPKLTSIEMVTHRLSKKERKEGYEEYQLLETSKTEKDVQKEIDALFKNPSSH